MQDQNKKNKHFFTVFILCAILITASPFFIQTKKVSALTPSNVLPSYFGGPITDTKNCDGDFVTRITVGFPSPGLYIKPWTIANDLVNLTPIYVFGKVDKGQIVLGKTPILKTVPCLVW